MFNMKDWLMVRHPNLTKNKMKRTRITFGFILPPVLLGFCAAIPPLFFSFYNPSLFSCFLNQDPPGCEDNPKVLCTRGEKADFALNIVFGYQLLGNLVIVVFIGLLIFAVYKQEKKSDQYLSKGQEKNRKNTYSTAWQGVRYTSAYFVTYFSSYVILGYDIFGSRGTHVSVAGKYTLRYFYAIFTPLIGFFNAGVYFYPRYSAKRQQKSELSRLVCLCFVLGFDGLGERLSDMSRDKTGTSSTPGNAKSGSVSGEEQKEEERPDKDVEDPKVVCEIAVDC